MGIGGAEPPSSVAGELGGSALGAVVVDQALAISGCGNEGRSGGIVEEPGQTVGHPVQTGDRIIGEDRVGATDQGQVVAQVRADSPRSMGVRV